MNIIITRHGETEENIKRIVQGHLPGVLSELGKDQACRLAERLRDEDIDLIVSSDLARALDTAKEIAKFHDVEIIEDVRLRNKDFKEFTGKKWEDIAINRDTDLNGFFREGEVESNKEIYSRAKSLLDDVFGMNKENILLVGHRGINKMIIAILMGKEFEDLNELRLTNTSVSVFEGEAGKMKMVLLNCAEHLR